jgi:hypothetical protein
MALRILHLCQFHFENQDIRVVGSEVDGGTSISGITDIVQTDGGGYWQADFSDGDFGGRSEDERAETLAWRALNAGLAGGRAGILRFCDRHHQPVLGYEGPAGGRSNGGATFGPPGAAASVLRVANGQAGGLNATILEIEVTSERALIGGERFTYIGAGGWGDRAAEISAIEDIPGGKRITFQPPIRGGIAVGDALDFDDPRCVMRRTSAPTNGLSMGMWSSASITFVEDMRDPTL